MAKTRKIQRRAMSDIETVVMMLLAIAIAILIVISLLEYQKDMDIKMKEDCIEQGFNVLFDTSYVDCYYEDSNGIKIYLKYDNYRGIWHAN